MDATNEKMHKLAPQNVTCMETAAKEEVEKDTVVKEEVTAAIEEVQEHVEVQVIVVSQTSPPQVRHIQARGHNRGSTEYWIEKTFTVEKVPELLCGAKKNMTTD
ncbi:hypothetical protein GBF38_021990 [Nibea albiflora]|uniref:Uncharacterized protein n=1 Tax=Nibea albiflora TaxID=240163 RepID=A0ACB7FHC1_NIBAL|nr:hypothetical protein GBF38_021990 [Nibea albiflora]